MVYIGVGVAAVQIERSALREPRGSLSLITAGRGAGFKREGKGLTL